MKAILALMDGTVFEGESFGAAGESIGEVVFNTGMTGYQEILTDPSYKGQMVIMTYTMIGNYGYNFEDFESVKPRVESFIVREYKSFYSNDRAKGSLGQFLEEHGIVGIHGIDTRALTILIRTKGAMNGIVSSVDLDADSLKEKVRNSESIVGKDLVKLVTIEKPYLYQPSSISNINSISSISSTGCQPVPQISDEQLAVIEKNQKHRRLKVVALDYGVKRNILEETAIRNCEVWVVPAAASYEDIMAFEPDGVLLSNGPGDPEPLTYAIDTVRKLIGKKPIFGICLGHQIIGLALGGKTFKLKFGHRGANHPVINVATGSVAITTQNHGFCVDPKSIPDPDVIVTHVNLNDGTLEGIKHKKYPVFSVQYHPEASSGPHDSKYLFDDFIKSMMGDWEIGKLGN